MSDRITKRLLRELLRKLESIEDKLKEMEEGKPGPLNAAPITVPAFPTTAPGTVTVPGTFVPNIRIVPTQRCPGGCTYPSVWMGIIPPSCSVCGHRASDGAIYCGSSTTGTAITTADSNITSLTSTTCELGPLSVISC